MMKIVVVADSLGCPRAEIDVGKTWVYKLIDKFGHDNIFYTFIGHGYSTDSIDFNLINEIHPDLLIIQLGIVDASRRASSKTFNRIIRKIPYLRSVWRKFASRHHFILTRLFEHRLVSPKKFSYTIKRILTNGIATNVAYIRIADAGEVMVKKTYNIAFDIERYNRIIKDEFELYVDPYLDTPVADYILESDGHHLNEYGHQLVYIAISKLIEEIKLA